MPRWTSRNWSTGHCIFHFSHHHFLSLIRQEVQAKLQEAVLGINGFATEEWPPGSGTSVATKETLDTMSEEFDACDVDTESVVGDFSRATQEDDLRPFDEATPTTITPAAALSIMEDDPKTREPMHASIVSALEAYVQVMYHPSKTNRACELSLECVTELVRKGYVSGRAGGRDDGTGSGSAQRQNQQQQQQHKPANGTPTQAVSPSLLHMVMDSAAKCSESNLETVQSRVVKAVKAIMTSPKCGIHEATMLLAVRSTFHIYLVTKSPICRQSSKMALLDVLQSVFFRMEAMELVAKASSPTAAATLGSLSTSQFHTDSFVLLRSLCKLSSKDLPGVDDNTATPSNFLAQQFSTTVYTDPLALSNKVLSLELIQALMECAGDAFCNGEKFIHLVQTQLCVALLKNCMSNHTTVAFLSQKIFLILVYKFKSHLKTEIEVFMSNIFLRVLESPNASFKQKALVLESLRSLCNDPVLLTQIFLTYDCDFDAMNLYKDIVFHLTKLSAKSTAQPISNLSKKEAEQHFELSLAAVEVLVSIFKSFLKALSLPGGDNKSDDTAGTKIRSILQLDAGLSPGPEGSLVLSTDLPISYPHLQQSKRHIEFEASISNLSGDGSSSGGGGLTAEDLERHQQAMQNSSANVAGKIVDAFNSKRNAEQNFELGSVKFTLSLKSGIIFFVDNGFVTLDAKEIANFFLVNKDKLDKTQMGEVLGREPDAAFDKKPGLSPDKGGPGFFVRILHHYADAMDFTNMMFDDAIRLFLSGFRLPGEAQKIDRIMEKFAERFTRQNLDIFPSADTAFILAFSVIMLNTDLHNPSIKPERRMTLDSFLRNNRGIGDNGADLPEDFLTGIFERIKKSPFSLKEDDAQREKVAVMESSFFLDTVAPGAFFGSSAEERKREKFKKEREEMVAATEQLIRRRASNRNVRVSVAAGAASSKLMDAVAPADVVKPMFDVTWGPMIGILSQVLECSDDERSIAVCLNGFVYAIRIAAHSGMSLARDTFINSLAKFTFLGSIKEMKRKNIESIRTLLSIAVIDGEYLGESWGSVLQCISQLARLRMTASGLYADDSFLKDGDNGAGSGSAMNGTPSHPPASDGSSLFRQPTKAEITRETEENNGKAILEAVNEVLIEKVFSSTVNLSAQSLAHFITQLVAVSSAEIEGNSKGKMAVVGSNMTPRNDASSHGGDDLSIFSLQRLVEVADYNMDVRPRLVWTQVWDIMAGFYSKAGCHRNAMVSVFAIDSLKQLSFKFLDKPESSEFNFQRNFLNPFLQVMENSGTREDIRELILQCVDNIIRSKSHNLQSGWKVFFSILTASASDSSERINFLGLNILQRLLDEHLDQLCLQPDELAGQKMVDHLTPLEKRNRNANAEDFIGMCRASLAFVQRKETDSPRPMGSSMRALCHTAIFADILAERRVPPPVSGAQFTDPDVPGYTYAGLKSETESLEMILWRPLFDGLAEGIRCTARSRAGVVGCLVQRGSVLAMRAILLRHGSCFTIGQLAAILQQTLMPALRTAVANDHSPVVNITSESPSVTSLDFLADPLPLPPPADDEELLKFEDVARKNDW
jgi:brefeldin A-inhibited guanine nucleotide-exchange protein